jgi:hypothetical protein
MKKPMHKGKAITVNFPVKSAEQLASSMGLSKRRTHRIFAIVDKLSGKTASPATANGKRKRSVAVKSRNSRIGQRSNATTSKSVKAAR